MEYAGKHALVLGLGESGLAMAQWLIHCGAKVRVADTRKEPERLAVLREFSSDVEFISGDFSARLLNDIDFVAVSPGLTPDTDLAEILIAAKTKKIPVWSEIELFAQALSGLSDRHGYKPKVIAITGTNGKTTVTSLTGLLCHRAGLSVKVAGNISPAVLDVLRKALLDDVLPQVWVLELSSFQLYATSSLNADVATVLNVTQDHLDWHGSMEAYAQAKARIFGKDTVRVLNREDETVMKMADKNARTVSFGLSEPKEAGSFGVRDERGMSWISQACVDSVEAPLRMKKNAQPPPIVLKHLMPADALKIRGQHNVLNAMAALALCRAIDLPMAGLLHGLREYKGEAHRVELVRNVSGVDYIDDSKGTNVGATVAALNGLGPAYGENKLALILGGDGKGQDFSPLIQPISKFACAVALIGKDSDKIRQTIAKSDTEIISCVSLEEAVQRLSEISEKGFAVLLSPACASMDMFRNYAHRSEVFVNAIDNIVSRVQNAQGGSE